jgi:hypothetical protein
VGGDATGGDQLNPEPTLAAVPALSYDRTVPRGFVHVRALSEIFIADSVRESDDWYLTAMQLPRTHGLWGDRLTDYHDPVVTLEVGRQTVFLVLHHYQEVPREWKFVLRRVDFRVVDIEAYRDDRATPPEGFSRVHQVARTQRHGVIESSFEGEATIGGRTAMAMTADITVLSPYNFTLLRAKGRGRRPFDTAPLAVDPVPLEPAQVGRTDRRNVVVYDAGGDGDVATYGLIVNQAHPAFFDHPHDHVTGSLILELFRQSAIAAGRRADLVGPGAMVTACSMSFEQFAELDAETTCQARVVRVTSGGDALLDLTLHQFGDTIAEARMQLSDQPQPDAP